MCLALLPLPGIQQRQLEFSYEPKFSSSVLVLEKAGIVRAVLVIENVQK
jgi:hypothetical protein